MHAHTCSQCERDRYTHTRTLCTYKYSIAPHLHAHKTLLNLTDTNSHRLNILQAVCESISSYRRFECSEPPRTTKLNVRFVLSPLFLLDEDETQKYKGKKCSPLKCRWGKEKVRFDVKWKEVKGVRARKRKRERKSLNHGEMRVDFVWKCFIVYFSQFMRGERQLLARLY